MEILKVAGQQMDNSINLNTQNGTKNVALQRGEISENLAADKSQNFTQTEVSQEQLDEAINKLNENMEQLKTNIRFGYNNKIDVMYVNVLEIDTNKVIRKIPSETIMNLIEHFQEIAGLLFDKKE